ncbi:MAG: nuclear transport factor 2 family protein [Thermomicrobiales bacterium]
MLRRTASHLLTTLVVVTVIASLLGAGWKRSNNAEADSGSATKDTVHAFYDAANRTIRSGNPDELSAIVAPDVVVHGPLAALGRDETGLSRYLASLHATAPHLQLTVTEVVVSGDRALVNLIVRGDEERAFLGSPLKGEAPWGAVDALRVTNSRVSEYWTGGTGQEILEPLAQAPFSVLPGGDETLTLDRLTLPPGGSFAAASVQEKRWLFVESSTVVVTTVRRDSSDSMVFAAPVGPEEPDAGEGGLRNPATAETGDFFALPLWSRVEIRNVGPASASLLVFAAGSPDVLGAGTVDPAGHGGQVSPAAELSWPGWGTSGPRVSESGATLVSLIGTVQPTLPAERSVLTVGRVTLAPGAELGTQVAGPLALVVDDGMLDLVTAGAPAWVYDGAGSNISVGTVRAGGGAVLSTNAVASWRNLGEQPVELTVVAIVPASAMSGGAA